MAVGTSPTIAADDSLRLSQIHGFPVHSAAGHRMGEVRDVMFGEDGRIQAVAVEFDAGKEMGSAYALAQFAWPDLALNRNDGHFVVRLGQETGPQNVSVDSDGGVTGRQIEGMSVWQGDRRIATVDDVLIDAARGTAEALLISTANQQIDRLPVTRVSINHDAVRITAD